ncbi:hypothetical protein PUN28_016695 [Cardiocondyla obscurior]|uniref:Secreted protein n=1 Tax=Cardiocondyla obscurior TaxID=286306 RepID=A0AAW2ENB0_9HYME
MYFTFHRKFTIITATIATIAQIESRLKSDESAYSGRSTGQRGYRERSLPGHHRSLRAAEWTEIRRTHLVCCINYRPCSSMIKNVLCNYTVATF